ncbi:TPA: ATP-dependent DNA ligase [Candidatus Bathyarchaeota archaeon]|nr:ATP-dependent DNA ligase [Candidatus Bathyarchaeota archaeon]
MRFEAFVGFLERIRATTSRNEKVSIAASLLGSLRPREIRPAIYLMRGTVFPAHDQRELNVGWSTLWRAISKLSAYGDEELIELYKRAGDLGLLAERAMLKRKVAPLHVREIELEDVYDTLVRVATLTGPSSAEHKERHILGLLGQVSPPEAKYVVKIVAGEMRYGLREGLLEEAIAKAFGAPLALIRRANMLTSDLGFVAETASKSVEELERLNIRLFRPVKHMLAEPSDTLEGAISYHGGKVAIEPKYDGCRLQVHKGGKEAKIYSRRLEDVTRSFPELVSELVSIPHDFIIDGEAVYWKDGRPGPFQYLVRRLRRKEDIDRVVRMYPSMFFAFDILYLDGASLVDRTYEERRKILEGVIPDGRHIACSERFTFTNLDEARRLFERSLEMGYEGLMIKDLESTYKPGRRGKHWFKYKEALETLDLVVVMAEYGHGARAGLLSDYTFAAWDENHAELVPVGKAYSGLTDAEILDMTRRLRRLAVKEVGTRVYLEPKIVMEVAFGDVQRSPRYPIGLALRFPRIKAIRDDLGLEDVDTVKRIRQIYEKLHGR